MYLQLYLRVIVQNSQELDCLQLRQATNSPKNIYSHSCGGPKLAAAKTNSTILHSSNAPVPNQC